MSNEQQEQLETAEYAAWERVCEQLAANGVPMTEDQQVADDSLVDAIVRWSAVFEEKERATK